MAIHEFVIKFFADEVVVLLFFFIRFTHWVF